MEAVWANRTRSLLTMIGVIIGIAAVIGALTLAQGVGAYLNNLIVGQGTNTILVEPGSTSNRSFSSKPIRQLSQEDLQRLSSLPHVAAITPVDTIRGQLVFGGQNWQTRVIGAGPDLQTIQSWDLAQGIWFTNAQNEGAQSVALLGDTVAHQLFDASGVNPIGQKIRINNQVFRVIGVLAPKGASGFGVSDDSVIVPWKTHQIRFTNSIYFGQINVEADTSDNVNLVVQEITTALEFTHHIPRGGVDDFQTTTAQQLLQQAGQATQAMSTLLTGIAAISLTVGGIGIMNIMLVSVTERTREIGIRMSIGAKRGDIRNQFLIESLTICLLGGVLGLLAGVLLGWSMIRLIAAIASGGKSTGSQVPLIITPTTLMLPLIISLAIGLIFGLYPAIRASRLDPIVALRKPR